MSDEFTSHIKEQIEMHEIQTIGMKENRYSRCIAVAGTSAQVYRPAIRILYALAIGLTALHVAGCISPLETVPPTAIVAIDAAADDYRPQVPLGPSLREYVLCHESRVKENGSWNWPVSGPTRNPIRIVSGGVVPAEVSCIEVGPDGRIRTVPGQCIWLRSTDGVCGEKK
ncbi:MULTISPECIES: hypothetical protein [unclassified Variovorax]|uniref:hypothetical protein n=1 Tax=unclassified Variovorax TaxID=663243 RepID=UPI003F483FDD